MEEIRFRDPRAGLKLAKFAPQLALLVPEDDGPEGRQAHRENLVRAYAVLGGSYRFAGYVAAAESEYARALKLVDSEVLSPVARADLGHALATLRARQDRFTEALDLIDSAETTYRAEGDERRLAEAYALRGYVLNEARRFTEATRWQGKALTLALSLERTKPADPADVAALARVVEAARAAPTSPPATVGRIRRSGSNDGTRSRTRSDLSEARLYGAAADLSGAGFENAGTTIEHYPQRLL